ncbi:hypothetical protein CK203_104008 [Vitis vinifera]|uniref:Uncharacterized protein n=1 Tax=Vitis vinifera TaxID=29760 RepID=A0A438FGE0_VITVI|nr:hypothetical protein CK203_104008 [Vitis vinifera]
MPLSRAFQKLMEGGLLNPLAPKPVPQPVPASLQIRPTLFLSSGTRIWHGSLQRFETCYSGFDRPGYKIDGISLGPQAPTPFTLIPDEAPFQLTHPTPLIIGCQDTFVSFTLWPEDSDYYSKSAIS